MSVRIFLIAGAASLAIAVASPSSAQVTRVSVGTGGTQADAASGPGVLSSDGRFVAFVSNATNLIPMDGNGSTDVFLRDLVGGTTTRLSEASDHLLRIGDSGALSANNLGSFTTREFDISGNGRFVVFTSRAPLDSADNNSCVVPPETMAGNCPDIYLYDRQSNAASRLTLGLGVSSPNGASRQPRISADGRWVVYESDASNLVTGDTNGVTDVFLLDRQSGTVTRVSQATGGAQADLASTAPSISDDGSAIAFLSASALLSTEPDTVPCERQPPACRRAFIVDRAGATTRRLPLPPLATTGVTDFGGTPTPYTIRYEVGSVDLSTDGSSVAVNALGTSSLGDGRGRPLRMPVNFIYYRDLDRRVQTSPVTWWDGRRYTYTEINDNDVIFGEVGLRDVVSGDHEVVSAFSTTTEPAIQNASGDGSLVLYSTLAAAIAGDTNGQRDLYLVDRDPDADGMSSSWETSVGLDPAVADGGIDADADGVTNAAEYLRGSHPRGTNVRYHAEGATNAFFSTQFAILNPGNTPATVVVRSLGDNGSAWSSTFAVPARQVRTLVGDGRFANSYATTIESDVPVVADRTMTWAGGHGSHAETAIAAPATTWFLAEGATHGAFSLFYLLQNPGPTAANIDITYLRPAPAAPMTLTYQVPPAARLTIQVDAIPQLAATDVSARIVSDVPILVERSMYMDTANPAQVFGAGLGGAGIAATNTRWFLAEGATGSFFDLYYLIANPSTQATRVRVTYLRPAGAPLVKEYQLAAQSRLTISVDGEDASLLDTPVSAIVESLDAVGIVVERSMWWPGQGQWYEGHLAAGATGTAQRWALASGTVGSGFETYVLIANTSNAAGTATITALPSVGGTPQMRTVPLPANSRVTVPMSSILGTTATFGTLVESDGPEIVVERAVYSNVDGIVWSAGTAALGTPLP